MVNITSTRRETRGGFFVQKFWRFQKLFLFFSQGEEDTFARKNKINDYFFGSLLTYSYLCRCIVTVTLPADSGWD